MTVEFQNFIVQNFIVHCRQIFMNREVTERFV